MISQPVRNLHLPAPRTSLIGRDQEVAETRDLVLRSQERLVTLTGYSGSRACTRAQITDWAQASGLRGTPKA